MGQRYSHLSLEERCRLRGLMEMGVSVSEIARRLGRHRSTIQRELGRNRCADGYRPDSAARRAWIDLSGRTAPAFRLLVVPSANVCWNNPKNSKANAGL